MCGRYSQKYDGRKLVVRYLAENRDFASTASRNIAPTQLAPVFLIEKGHRVLKLMKWGFIPSWAKDPKIGVKCFNARAETVSEKPAFRSSFKSRRALIPVDSFYEWREEVEILNLSKAERAESKTGALTKRGRKFKQPYRFTVAGESIFSLAGLYSTWKNSQGQVVESYTIITTEPNSLLAEYHNRMPVIIPKEKEQVWVDPNFSYPVLLQGMLQPFPAGQMEAEIIAPKAFQSEPTVRNKP